MFTVNADQMMRRLNITINNYYDEEDLKSICYMIDREITRLDEGFIAAIDVRGMRVLEQKWTRYMKRIQSVMMEHRVSKIATLVDNVILKMQLQRLGNETGSTDITRQFNDEDEWRMFISTPPKMDKPHSSMF
ncbi:MAG: hypothetical protein R3C26_19450 [Calditrichia bacterium]|nr:hypothetical protein [Calditrichota bacterium]MCB0270823.1 hypothetical protein [Calditrichota bacterium]MCB0286776.1 hypothetical protein [Calditrichota bacterium]MCB9068314.1 hypothetical protein [Calditrichia bacterium]